MIRLNGVQVTPTIFPDGTSQIWHLPDNLINKYNKNQIVWQFSSEAELMHLCQLKNLIDYVVEQPNPPCALYINYLPYGRQDKEVSNNTTFALHTFSQILNLFKFDEIQILDPHSDEATWLINNSRAVYNYESIHFLMQKHDFLCYPDKGAATKYDSVHFEYEYITAEKLRDQASGNIINYKLNLKSDISIKNKNILIRDDICDGGATFVLLAKALYDAGAKEVNLFVTHGIFSKGLKPLLDAGIKRIFTKDGEAGEIQNNITYRRL